MPPPEALAVIEAMVALLGRDRVLDGDATSPYAVDGLLPAAVCRPATADELAAVLAEASRLRAATIPWGGGTSMAMGNLPEAYHLTVDTRALDRVIEYEPADLTITVEAGITLENLQQTLAGHGQSFPIDPPGWREATLGGALAAAATGPSRHAYGPARDWVLGLRVAHADGRISRGGGRVVKNVAGYDMPKLYVGSLGTLGVIVEASLKVVPLPAAEVTWLAPCPSTADGVALALEAHGRRLRLRALAVVCEQGAVPHAREIFGQPEPTGGAATYVAALAAGASAAVERSLRDLDGLAAAAGLDARRLGADENGPFWEGVRALCRPSEEGPALVRAAFPPSGAAALIHDLEALRPVTVVAYPAAGVAHASFDAAALWARAVTQLRQSVPPERGGSVVVEAGPRSLKERVDVFGEPQEDFPLMQRLKEQMDRHVVLNRGRFLGRL